MKTASDLMTTEVFTVTPQTKVADLAKLFTEKQVSGFPVVDESGALVGIITESDLIHRNERLHIPTMVTIFDAVLMLGSTKKVEDELKRMAATEVGEIMSTEPVTVATDADVSEIATVMGDRHIHTIPVVDPAGKLVGVIGKRDLIRNMAR